MIRDISSLIHVSSSKETSQFYIYHTRGTNRNVVKIISIELVVGQLANET